jgi:hypothetical protein
MDYKIEFTGKEITPGLIFFYRINIPRNQEENALPGSG